MLLRIVLQELFQKAPTWQTRILHWSLTEIPVHVKQKRLERKYFLFSEHLPNKHKIHLGLTITLYPPFMGGGSCCDWNDCIVICLKKLLILVTSPKQMTCATYFDIFQVSNLFLPFGGVASLILRIVINY